MKLNIFESKMLKDALVEYWHNSIKHSENERVKEQYKNLMEDVKQITQSNERHSITLNN